MVGTLSTTAPKIGDTFVLNIDTGLQQAAQGFLAQQILTDRHTFDAVDGQYPPALNGAVDRDEPEERRDLRPGLLPVL